MSRRSSPLDARPFAESTVRALDPLAATVEATAVEDAIDERARDPAARTDAERDANDAVDRADGPLAGSAW